MSELPAAPLTPGLFWSWLVPAVLFVIAAGATWGLYRHFARQHDKDDS